jgi:excisionase family DNA binding protein
MSAVASPADDFAPILVRVERAAEMLGISRSQVYVLLARREIESVAIGRSRRIPVQSLHQYVDHLREVSS